MDSESRKVSFWYDDSVALTDLLLYLDYSGEVCTCLPEYSVDTEFGAGYGVSLTGGFARRTWMAWSMPTNFFQPSV